MTAEPLRSRIYYGRYVEEIPEDWLPFLRWFLFGPEAGWILLLFPLLALLVLVTDWVF